MDKFTVEEMNLMCIYDTSSRDALLSDMKTGLANVYEPQMRDIFESAIEKLESLTNEEFSEIGFYIADEYVE